MDEILRVVQHVRGQRDYYAPHVLMPLIKQEAGYRAHQKEYPDANWQKLEIVKAMHSMRDQVNASDIELKPELQREIETLVQGGDRKSAQAMFDFGRGELGIKELSMPECN